MRFLNLCILAGYVWSSHASSVDQDGLTVKTITGTYTGLIDDEFPDVRQFRNIPYAQPPIGQLRWMPPVAPPASQRHAFSHRFPPSCPQFLPRNRSSWNTDITDFSVQLYGQNRTQGAVAQSSSEDCLSVAIWTPRNASADALLPVLLFVPGGSFTGGGVEVPYQTPTPWVQRTQKHLVASLNYRLNIAGFPWAAGLEEQNLGILDQRMALEWVYANIRAFGGDPSRITLWGQSAGAVAVDFLNYGWWDDPLAAAFFLQSGTAMVNITYPDPLHRNFTFVAKNLGCDFANDPRAELECMRQVPMTLIQNFVGEYAQNSTKPALTFLPISDDKRVFFNYTARAEKGFIAKRPAIVSTTANEETTLYKYPASNVTDGPYQPSVNKDTLKVFVCPAYNTSNVRAQNNLTTYRYQFAGNFSNITPWHWMGAYHASDVPMIFGTYERPGPATEFQKKVAETMQDYLLAFITDPANGLEGSGWVPDNRTSLSSSTMLRFGSQGTVQTNISVSELDNPCIFNSSYNPTP